ncbi:universal stress protein [Uliginosibacterium sp. 31-16]|uniref:universal stress protein n=1 Tax=Uliginosibacterium sp. 31-16 TaxID=3068315 RepID=UPI00273D7D0B|nr:universal stress protein [Uliginosibacterium sp. 31-16]MDP5240342.1 universal stress protein [Uliginosibacterium sp. 31-16]
MRKILLAVDGSEHSDKAVQFVVDFCREHGPLEIHLLTVEPKPEGWQTHGMEAEAIKAQLKMHCHAVQQSAHALLQDAGLNAQAHFREGNAAETIVLEAGKLGCDVIVMGSRGLGAFSGITLGSVTRKVLHLAQTPVVCVK